MLFNIMDYSNIKFVVNVEIKAVPCHNPPMQEYEEIKKLNINLQAGAYELRRKIEIFLQSQKTKKFYSDYADIFMKNRSNPFV